MRKRFLLSLLVALLTTLSTRAYDFKSGDLYYNITSDNTVEVTYQEKWSESNYQGLTTATIPATVTYNGTTYSVTSIGGEAFYYCSSLTSITIPNSVTSIGEWAFEYCYALTFITIPNSVTSIGDDAFTWCSSLTSITIPNSVTSIENSAFNSCSSLTSIVVESGNTVYDSRENCNAIIETASNTLIAGCQSTTIPNSVTSIGNYAFAYCSSLTSITLPNSVTSIGEWAFISCSSLTSITIPNSVTSIGEWAFYNCSSLTSLTLPNSVTSIGDRAFNGCSSLTSVIWNAKNCAGWSYESYAPFYEIRANITSFTFGEEVETIPSYLCYGMSSLTSVTIPDSVTSIGERAFSGCSSLTSITIGNSVTSIGWYAFSWCSSLTSVTIPNSVTSIGNYAFSSCKSLTSIIIPNSVTSIGESAFSSCKSLTSIILPNSVTSIGKYAFSRCSSLTSITIGNSVTSIGDWAFEYCSSLTSIILPNSVTSTGNYAFSNCSSLTSITIPNSVTSIGGGAFEYCSSLTSITIPNSVTSIGGGAFNGCSSLTSVTLPNSVTSIGAGAFVGCSSLTSITIPNSVISIGWAAFEGCSALTSITLPNSVTSIEKGVFHACSSLTSITLSNSVTSIGEGAFSDCSALTSITIPNSVTSIGRSAFSGCSSLTSITIPNSVTSIGESAFKDVRNIVYSGTATGSPWGARSVNGYVEGYLVYADETKTTLLACSAAATGEVTIPNSVTSIGGSAFSGCSSLTSITIGNSVTSIGSYAFWNCSSLTSITIGNSVTSIGDNAFRNCSSLTSITLPNSVTSIGGGAFEYCSSLTSITIGNSVTTIGGSAFSDCSSLTSITLPNSVTSIGNSAFSRCKALTSITIGNSVASIGDWAFSGCSSLTSITIPNSVTSIGDWAFQNCTSLTSITMGNSVTSIGDCAFSDCSSLTSITIPNSVTSIGDYAFSGCSSLTSIILPNSVTSIGGGAFEDCSSLTSIILPNSVTSIGDWAFQNCTSLTSITIPNSVTSIGRGSFSGCSSLTTMVVESGNTVYDSRENCNAIIETATNTLIAGCQSTTIPNSVTSIGKNAFAWYSSLTSITIPNSVTSIGEYAFSNVPNIVYNGTATGSPWGARSVNGYVDGYFVYADDTKTTLLACSAAATGEITIPNSVTSIGNGAFRNCSALTSITIPNSVTTIGGSAFYGCSALTSITIPNSVTTIGGSAFSSCSALTSVTSLSCTPPSCGSYVFNYTPSEKTLVVPSISIDAYKKSSTWKDFTSFKKCLSVFVQSSDSTMGFAKIEQDVDCDSVAIISATANYGYHFKQWNDGNTDNPRTIKLTQDTTFTAEFAPNQYTLTTTTNYAERGTVQGDTIADYLTELQVSASANYGYHFTQWGDGNTDNPRTISLTKDINVVALFDKNQYTITTYCNTEQGNASETQTAEYLDEVTISATANYGYHFKQWNDGNADNPRTIKLTQDTTFVAEFEMDYSGKCGDELYWAYSNQEIKITGTGAMYNYTDSTMPWTLLRDSIKTVRVGNNATSIGEYAFANTRKLAELQIGTGVEDIGANAFAGCNRIYHIYCYPTYPPFADESSFANYNVYLHIPCENKEDYTLDLVWGKFKFIECIGSEDVVVTDDEVVVAPSYEDVTITWPIVSGADTYSLVLTKEGDTFCTLVFNAQGQLVSIAFKPRRQNAPAEEGTTPATYAEQTANGFRFTVTGLEEGSAYAYTLTVRNAANSVLETYTGEFTTLSNTPTGINESAGEDGHGHGQVEKLLHNGQVLIIRNGETYDMMGQRL